MNIKAKEGFGNKFSQQETLKNQSFGKIVDNFLEVNKNSIGFKIVENLKKDIKIEERKQMIEEKLQKRLKDEEEYLKISDLSKIKKDLSGLGFDKLTKNYMCNIKKLISSFRFGLRG